MKNTPSFNTPIAVPPTFTISINNISEQDSLSLPVRLFAIANLLILLLQFATDTLDLSLSFFSIFSNASIDLSCFCLAINIPSSVTVNKSVLIYSFILSFLSCNTDFLFLSPPYGGFVIGYTYFLSSNSSVKEFLYFKLFILGNSPVKQNISKPADLITSSFIS